MKKWLKVTLHALLSLDSSASSSTCTCYSFPRALLEPLLVLLQLWACHPLLKSYQQLVYSEEAKLLSYGPKDLHGLILGAHLVPSCPYISTQSCLHVAPAPQLHRAFITVGWHTSVATASSWPPLLHLMLFKAETSLGFAHSAQPCSWQLVVLLTYWWMNRWINVVEYLLYARH